MATLTHTPAGHRAAAAPTRGLPAVALVFLASSVGAHVVAVSYVLARQDTPGANAVLWLGQLLMFAPMVIFAIVVRKPSARSAAGVAVVLGLVPYLVKIFYSPRRLTFGDELQHRLGTLEALQTHHLGATNYALPISGKYPGLESIGSAFSAMTGLSVDASAMIVMGLAKTAVTVGILMLFAELTQSYRRALIGTLLYAANGNFEFFSSFYVYQNVALVFAIFALYLGLRLRRQVAQRRLVLGAALASIALTVVTHHATAMVLCSLLCVVAAIALVRRDPVRRSAVVLAVGSVAMTLGWFSLVAPGTWSYLGPYLSLKSPSLQTDVPLPDVRFVIPQAPFADRVLDRVGLATVVVLVAIGMFLLLRGGMAASWPAPWRFLFGGLAVALILSAGVAATAAFGYQVASRALVYTFLGAAAVGALAVVWITGQRQSRYSGGRVAVSVAAMLLCLVGGLQFGWPPWWEKLPGAYHPTGYESGVDPLVLQATTWVAGHVPAQSRFAADGNGSTALAAIADQSAQTSAAPIFYDRTITKDDRYVLGKHKIRYIWIDRRVASSFSLSGRYFSGSIGVQYTYPPPMAGLTKWLAVPGVSTIYTDGTITILDLTATSLYG